MCSRQRLCNVRGRTPAAPWSYTSSSGLVATRRARQHSHQRPAMLSLCHMAWTVFLRFISVRAPNGPTSRASLPTDGYDNNVQCTMQRSAAGGASPTASADDQDLFVGDWSAQRRSVQNSESSVLFQNPTPRAPLLGPRRRLRLHTRELEVSWRRPSPRLADEPPLLKTHTSLTSADARRPRPPTPKTWREGDHGA